MYRWIPYAFVRITIFYGAGIVLAISFPQLIAFENIVVLCPALILVFTVCATCRWGKTVFAGGVAAAALVSTGILNVFVTDESRSGNHLTHVNEKVKAFRAVIQGAPQERPRTWKYEIVIDQVLIGSTWQRSVSKALLYLKKDSSVQRQRYGDVVVVRSAPGRIGRPLNPGEFDLEAFQRYRQVYFQSITSPGQVIRTGHERQNPVAVAAITARLWAEDAISRRISGRREQAIASAFVLGVMDGLDNELMSAYAATGAMHVLSVSGLHVGIVYWLLLIIFKPLGPERLRWTLLAVSLVVLWSYAFVTGISAPVLRAVVMFSFAAIARAFRYRINIYNILGATACMLLVYDPFMIMSVGFQLSFIAVLGIVAIQPGLYRLWEPTAWLCDEAWKVCSVSLAAQLATLPLCLLYFHQFPNYFLITNLFIVPGSFLVLVLGIMLLAVSAVDFLAQWIGWLLEFLIDLLNRLIFAVEQLPYSVVENIFITPLQVFVLASLIVALLVWAERRTPRWLCISFCLAMAFPAASWIKTLDSRQPTITIYAISGATAVDLIADQVTIAITRGGPLSNPGSRLPNRIARQGADRIVDAAGVPLQNGCDLYCWKGRSLIHVYGPLRETKDVCTPDFVIISNNAVKDLSILSGWLISKCYVVDGSNSREIAERLEKQGEVLDLNIYSVMRKGALNQRL